MKRTLRKLFKVTLLSFISAFLTIVAILLFPRPLFANKLHYKEFTVCSNAKIDPAMMNILDNAKTLVQGSELYTQNYHFNIILAHHTFYNKIDDKLMGYGPAARARLNNVIIKIGIDPATNTAFASFPKTCQTNLSELIAHEMVHCLQTNKYGIKKFNPYNHPPYWKLEGYPEYISKKAKLSNSNYSFIEEIKRYNESKSKTSSIWIEDEEGGCEAPDYYWRGRLMIEYLMRIRNWSYDRVLKDTNSENTIFTQMLQWKDSAMGH
jgi:hypothetical protein